MVAAILLGTLLFFRNDFYAVGDRRTRWLALWVFLGLAVADIAIGLGYLSVNALDDNFPMPTRMWTSSTSSPARPVPSRSSRTGGATSTTLLTTALGFFTLIVTAYLFLRPAEPKARLAPGDADRIRELLDKHGDRDSLGYFALRDDKSVIWSPTGKACVCYRVVSGVMLAGGDPIGDPEAWPGAIQAFLDQAARTPGRPRSWAAASWAPRSGAGKVT